MFLSEFIVIIICERVVLTDFVEPNHSIFIKDEPNLTVLLVKIIYMAV